MEKQTLRRGLGLILVVLLIGLAVAGVVAWTQYRQIREAYDAYQTLIQPGITIAGLDVGWHTPEDARAKVEEWVARPYYEDLALSFQIQNETSVQTEKSFPTETSYQGEVLTLSPVADLGLVIPLDDMVAGAVTASHQYDYWEGFKLWVQDEAIYHDLDIPFRMDFDPSAAGRYLNDVAESFDITPTEPMVDVQGLTFLPGSPGRKMDVGTPAAIVNELVPNPTQRDVSLPVTILEPDQSRARIESMLSTLVPVMERPPTAPTYYTATVPISTTGGISGTPTADYTGPLTWTFPHFVSYTGHLTQTYGFFFEPGEPGYTFNVDKAIKRTELALAAGSVEPIVFEPDLVPPPPITPALLLPPLEQRLATFPGVTTFLLKDLETGEVIYDANNDYVLSGMSLSKIGIMVEVIRYLEGEIDNQTRQELYDMLGSESCNPCANRLLALVGGGSAKAGAQKVTDTMRRLGLANFYLCAPFRVVRQWDDALVFVANTGLLQEGEQKPGWDPCVKATPREMANLVEMIYSCTQDEGLLRDAYPNTFAPQVCDEMIDIMAANDLRNMLGAGIPHETKMAHKHGFSGYDVPWGDTRAEVGVIYTPAGDYLISFYIWEDTPWINWGINQPLYRDISNMVHNFFGFEEPFWPLPPWAPAPEEESEEEGA